MKRALEVRSLAPVAEDMEPDFQDRSNDIGEIFLGKFLCEGHPHEALQLSGRFEQNVEIYKQSCLQEMIIGFEKLRVIPFAFTV